MLTTNLISRASKSRVSESSGICACVGAAYQHCSVCLLVTRRWMACGYSRKEFLPEILKNDSDSVLCNFLFVSLPGCKSSKSREGMSYLTRLACCWFWPVAWGMEAVSGGTPVIPKASSPEGWRMCGWKYKSTDAMWNFLPYSLCYSYLHLSPEPWSPSSRQKKEEFW